MSDEAWQTNLQLKGVLQEDPRAVMTDKGKLIVNLNVKVRQSNKRMVAVPFVTFDEELGAYIIEKYRKGTFIKIKKASPTPYNPHLRGYRAGHKWIIWALEVNHGEDPDHDGDI